MLVPNRPAGTPKTVEPVVKRVIFPPSWRAAPRVVGPAPGDSVAQRRLDLRDLEQPVSRPNDGRAGRQHVAKGSQGRDRVIRLHRDQHDVDGTQDCGIAAVPQDGNLDVRRQRLEKERSESARADQSEFHASTIRGRRRRCLKHILNGIIDSNAY